MKKFLKTATFFINKLIIYKTNKQGYKMNNATITFIPTKDAYEAPADVYAPKFYKDRKSGF